VAAAGIVKGQAVVALDEKKLPIKPRLELSKCHKFKFKLDKTKKETITLTNRKSHLHIE